MIEYRLRDKDTGLFYTGGRWGHWTKRGKFYSSKGIANGIKSRMRGGENNRVEVVAFKITEVYMNSDRLHNKILYNLNCGTVKYQVGDLCWWDFQNFIRNSTRLRDHIAREYEELNE